MAFALDLWVPADIERVTDRAGRQEPKIAKVLPIIQAAPAETPNVVDEDQDLLDRLTASDETAFRLLVERYSDRAYSIALRIVESAADAEDVVQDTLLKVWIHRGQWQHGRAKFSTWLYRVVTNRCIDLRRRPRTDDVDAIPEPVDSQPDAVSALQRNEVNNMLEVAMGQLPEQQRVAVILSYHEDMTNAEIAEVMDTTISAVESYLKRGRQHLKKLLRRKEGDIRNAFTD